MLSVTYAAGLRVSELVGLTAGDVDLSRGIVSAFGKGGKRRLVPLGNITLDHVQAYLNARAELGAGATPRVRKAGPDVLFPSPRGGRAHAPRVLENRRSLRARHWFYAAAFIRTSFGIRLRLTC